ncbi:RNA polymerase sigma factor [Gemmatimonas phototrophica]|uniref:RNA polymerase sigma factor n=1 Tax=Gemmatimonas phototrophica TaxID=1379270 RepID=UPI001930F766|nr:RNA polymerase sigma factor [Gemmatimonas phototrophica]
MTEPTLDTRPSQPSAFLPDAADVAAAAGGDRRAFERVYRTHVPKVYSLCLRMLGDRTLADEVTQDVFVRVWEKLPGFRGDSAFGTWLHRVAVNVVLTRRKTSGIQHGRAADDDALELAPTRHEPVGDRLDLEGAIAQLPKGARTVFVLHDVQGFTHEEIGEQLGITPGGSKAQLHRARLLLRAALTR